MKATTAAVITTATSLVGAAARTTTATATKTKKRDQKKQATAQLSPLPTPPPPGLLRSCGTNLLLVSILLAFVFAFLAFGGGGGGGGGGGTILNQQQQQQLDHWTNNFVALMSTTPEQQQQQNSNHHNSNSNSNSNTNNNSNNSIDSAATTTYGSSSISITAATSDNDNDNDRALYGVMIDAGSTGTRAHIFQWPNPQQQQQQHFVNVTPTAWVMKVSPGISSYAHEPEKAGESLRPLMEFVIEKLKLKQPIESSTAPSSSSSTTTTPRRPPVFFKATAGVRLLPKPVQMQIVDSVRRVMRAYSHLFEFKDEYAQAISGKEEAVFDWISVNHLSGRLTSATSVPHRDTMGAMDLGGASTQVAFVPSPDDIPDLGSSDHSDSDFVVIELGGVRYTLYAHSFLDFGMQRAFQRYRDAVLAEAVAEQRPQWLHQKSHHLHAQEEGPTAAAAAAAASTATATTTTVPLITVQDPCLPAGYMYRFTTTASALLGLIKSSTSNSAAAAAAAAATTAATTTTTTTTTTTMTHANVNVTLEGAGNADQCIAWAQKLLRRDKPCGPSRGSSSSPSMICSFDGVYQPRFPTNSSFIAFDYFSGVVAMLGADPYASYDSLEELEAKARAVCELPWEEARLRPRQQGIPRKHRCFYGQYILAVLRDGYRFFGGGGGGGSHINNNNNNDNDGNDNDSTNVENASGDGNGKRVITFAPKMEQVEISWALGAMVYEVNRMHQNQHQHQHQHQHQR